MLNPGYFDNGQWDEFGYIIWSYINALHLSVWNSSDMYKDIEEVFYNVVSAYYILYLNIMRLQSLYGQKKWVTKSLPLLTIQNTTTDMCNMVVRCLYFPKKVPFYPKRQREICVEQHFARTKKPIGDSQVGMPKLADMITGTVGFDILGLTIRCGRGCRGKTIPAIPIFQALGST